MTATARSSARRRAELFWTLCVRQLRLRRQRSFFGLVYPFFVPLVYIAMYTFLFKGVFNVPIKGYPTYLCIGLLPWVFFTQSMYQSQTSLSTEAELLRRAPFPSELLPLSAVVMNAGPFLVLLGALAGIELYTRHVSVALLSLLVIPLTGLALLVASGALLLAWIDVYNRDLRLLLGNMLQFWFFLIPIVYKPEMVQGNLRALRSIDPMNMIVGQLRDILYYGHFSRPLNSVLMMCVCMIVFGLSIALFRRVAPMIPRDV